MREMPLFPLDTVLFPGMPIHLHIFEPRYRQMIQFCLDNARPFGVVLIRRGAEANGPLAEPESIGTAAAITEVERLPDGRMNIIALGDERFRILELNYDLPYLVGKVECLPLQPPVTLEMISGLRRLRPLAHHYLTLLSRQFHENLDLSGLRMPEDPGHALNMAAGLLQIPPAEKQPLLAAISATDLFVQVERLYRREIALLSAGTMSHLPHHDLN